MRPPLWLPAFGIPVSTGSGAPSVIDPGAPCRGIRTIRLSDAAVCMA